MSLQSKFSDSSQLMSPEAMALLLYLLQVRVSRESSLWLRVCVLTPESGLQSIVLACSLCRRPWKVLHQEPGEVAVSVLAGHAILMDPKPSPNMVGSAATVRMHTLGC